ncbi:hypothetical protein [Anaeroselena agilis]|uniref:Uncharacterized protein n=1 Tax=Anaeroselena agilis TaxID=3063788 RepID=A0ABU3NUA6_9FIRM|nr:hypothetical protein [Selenomonadales bacterium 4137-cl]
MEKSDVKVKGSLCLTLKKEDGTVEVRRKDNIIVAGGFDFICQQIAGTPANVMNAIALGTGTNTPVASQTALTAEVARQAATYSHTAGTQVFTLSATFNPGVATAAITEAGVFNSATASSGTMLDRVVFSVINKGENDTLTAQFQFTLS